MDKNSKQISPQLLKTRMFLYFRILSEFENYKANREQTERLLDIPATIKSVLGDIIKTSIFTNFLVNNEYLKAKRRAEEEKERRRKLEEERKKELERKARKEECSEEEEEEDSEEEEFNENKKLIQYARARNATCYGQRSICVIKNYYNSFNEIYCTKNEICENMFNIVKDCLNICINLKKSTIIKSENFVLSSNKPLPVVKLKKKALGQTMLGLYPFAQIKRFASVDELNKMKQTLKSTFGSMIGEDSKIATSQFKLLLDNLQKRKKYNIKMEKIKDKYFPNLNKPLSPNSFNVKIKDKSKSKSKEKVKNRNLPAIMQLNTFVKYRMSNRKRNITEMNKNLLMRDYENYREYNYGNIVEEFEKRKKINNKPNEVEKSKEIEKKKIKNLKLITKS